MLVDCDKEKAFPTLPLLVASTCQRKVHVAFILIKQDMSLHFSIMQKKNIHQRDVGSGSYKVTQTLSLENLLVG